MADLTLAQMVALLADNVTGEISATDVQNVITALSERTDGTNPLNGLLFDTSPDIPAHTAGHMHWNDAEGVAEIMTGTAGVTLQLGHEQYLESRNDSGATLLNGRPVRITGSLGNRPTIALDNGQGRIVGLMTHDLANNSNGKATTFGLVRDINTSAFSSGDEVFASSTGTLTTSLTSSRVGFVGTSHVTQGTVLVLPATNTNTSGTTAARPTTVIVGFKYFDTTLGIPVWWNGTNWVDATGGVV